MTLYGITCGVIRDFPTEDENGVIILIAKGAKTP